MVSCTSDGENPVIAVISSVVLGLNLNMRYIFALLLVRAAIHLAIDDSLVSQADDVKPKMVFDSRPPFPLANYYSHFPTNTTMHAK